jgi:hypothetical protein
LLTHRASPSAVVRLDEAVIGQSVEAVINALIDGEPAIAVGQNYLHERGIGLAATVLQPGEEQIVAERMRAVLAQRR